MGRWVDELEIMNKWAGGWTGLEKDVWMSGQIDVQMEGETVSRSCGQTDRCRWKSGR